MKKAFFLLVVCAFTFVSAFASPKYIPPNWRSCAEQTSTGAGTFVGTTSTTQPI